MEMQQLPQLRGGKRVEGSMMKSYKYFESTPLLIIQLLWHPGITLNENYIGKNKAGESFGDQTFQMCMDASESQLGASVRWFWSILGIQKIPASDRLSENLEDARKVICKPLLGVLKLITLAPRFLLC